MKRVERILGFVERVGNRLPDPAILFFVLMLVVWVVSALLEPVAFAAVDPRTQKPLQVVSLLAPKELARLVAELAKIFTGFQPLGVVLVALIGVGVAEHSGLITAALKWLLSFTPKKALTPMVIGVGLVSHVAADAGFVVVIPLAGVIFHAAGRHPLVGIAAGFCGVSGGFNASPVPTALDPLLQGFTQAAARLIDPNYLVNPLCNFLFNAASTVLVIAIGWFITEKVVEPRFGGIPVEVDGEPPRFDALTPGERRGLWAAAAALIAVAAVFVTWASPETSALRAPNGELTSSAAPLMQGVVSLIFIGFAVPGVAFGLAAGTIRSHRDVVAGMTKAMGTMTYYIVMVFFAALFIDAFGRSNIGALLALEGAESLRALHLPGSITIVGLIVATMFADVLIGSASAKWAILSPVFVPMLMQLGIAPELTQAAYRIGDSFTNIVTPLMPYFPLVVMYCQKYVKKAGIGTVLSMMMPYAVALGIGWTLFLLAYWGLGLPLGLGSRYTYP